MVVPPQSSCASTAGYIVLLYKLEASDWPKLILVWGILNSFPPECMCDPFFCKFIQIRLLYHPTRSSDYHQIQWLVMGTYIHNFLEEKERNGDQESLMTLLSGTTVAILWRTLQKKLEVYKLGIGIFLSWSFPLFSAEMPRSNKKRASIGTKVSVFSRFLHPSFTIQQRYPNRGKHHRVSELIILGRMWRKVSSRDKEGWCLEVSHEDFNDCLFVNQRMVLIHKEVDEEGIFETTSQVE